MSTTVSAKIPEELREELEAAGINISETIREALEAEIRRRRRSELLDRASELRDSIDEPFDSDEIADEIREDRCDH